MAKLEQIDFSDTIGYQHRSDMVLSIKSMLSYTFEKNILSIDISDNMLYVDGARSFADFFQKNSTLQIFKASNCGLGAKSFEMLVQAQQKNKGGIHLKELHLAHNAIDDQGMKFLSLFLKGLKSNLEIFDISFNVTDEKSPAIATILEGVNAASRGLTSINVAGNLGINSSKAVEQLKQLLTQTSMLETVNISAMGMSAKTLVEVKNTLLEHFKKEWNLNCKLRTLLWNEDFAKSLPVAEEFIGKELPSIYNQQLSRLQMIKVFKSESQRTKLQLALEKVGVEAEFTDVKKELKEAVSKIMSDTRKSEKKSKRAASKSVVRGSKSSVKKKGSGPSKAISAVVV
mmetsp:Transcript_6327/g.10745  ORF Transcript_6327/g.10745 Transcript_6327/m.10745 type:complete len:343 (-) Transcript_6327:8-1036(-)